MKTKRASNKLVGMLNKKTIAHLNRQQMVLLRSGERQDAGDLQLNLITYTCTCNIGITPVPTDSGITPFAFC